MRRLSVTLVTLALLGVTLGAVQQSSSAAPEQKLAEKQATWTSSMQGMPTSSDPGRQLQRVDFRMHYDTNDDEGIIDVDVKLKGAPLGDPDSRLMAGVGRKSGSNCQLDHVTSVRVWAADGTEVRTIWESGIEDPDPAWDCGIVAIYDVGVTDFNSAVPFDATGGTLRDVHIQPKLKVGKVEQLDKNQKKLKLVHGVQQMYRLTVRNTGGLAAKGVVVTGTGKGVKVKKTKLGRLEAGATATVRVPITLTANRAKTKVTLKVKGSGATANKKMQVRRVAAPARPAAGAWKAEDFTFKVKGGKIVKFRGVNLRMTCSPPLGYPTYRNVTLSFPKTAIPKHGIVDATVRYRKGNVWYNASLSGRIVGKKMTNAKFTYFTAGSCSVIERFTARRKG